MALVQNTSAIYIRFNNGEQAMIKQALNWLRRQFSTVLNPSKQPIDEMEKVILHNPQRSVVDIEFVWDQHQQPRMLVSHDAKQLETHWIASLINGEIKNSLTSAQNLQQHIQHSLEDPDYYWSGTTNSLEIVVTHAKIELLPLYEQFNGSKEIQHQSLLPILADWIEFIRAGISN